MAQPLLIAINITTSKTFIKLPINKMNIENYFNEEKLLLPQSI